MPYIENYVGIINSNLVEIKYLIWDRFHTEETNKDYIFRLGPIQHKRRIFDYIKFSKFIKNHLEKFNYDGIICFGLQTAYFIEKELYKLYRKKFILDIRDHNRIADFCNFNKIIASSYFTTISSPGYLSWLPKKGDYIVNHNTILEDTNNLEPIKLEGSGAINISSIGALRDFKININFIKSINNDIRFKLKYHGKGDINDELKSFIHKNKYDVEITGQYIKSEEKNLYQSSDIINVLRYADGKNNITALPNRLYAAPYFGRPLLAFSGTLLGEIIENYSLGLVIKSFDNAPDQIADFVKKFNGFEYDIARKKFLDEIINENNIFKKNVNSFIESMNGC